MQDKVPSKRRQRKPVDENEIQAYVISLEQGVEVKVDPISYGIATTDLAENGILKGEQVDIFEDKEDHWLTNKGLVSKLYLLLRKIK